MKLDLQKKIQKRMRAQDKLYGTTTLGSRGQLVIPAQARKDLGLKPGDQIVVMGKFGKVLGLMKTDQLADFVETIMGNLSGTGLESQAKEHFQNFFGGVLQKKRREP